MADLSFNIGFPVLLPGQAFRIEYKLSSDAVYTLFGIEADQDVTITGLTEGECYDIRITFLKSISPLVECEAQVIQKCIPNDIPCIEVSGEIGVRSDTYTLTVTFILPSPFIQPCGGYKLVYAPLTSPASSETTIYYPTFPSGDLIVPGIANQPYYVEVYSIDCQGNEVLCDSIVVPPADVSCVHAEVLDAEIISGDNGYFIKLTIQPSDPATSVYNISYSQFGTLTSGVLDMGITTANGTGSDPEIFIFPISPNLNIQPENGTITLKYNGGISDDCRWLNKWEAERIL